MFPKSIFFHLNGWQALCACACPDGQAPPFRWKNAFWKYFECENSFCKKSRNLSWVGAGFSFKWLNFSKNAWNFTLFEFWSGCRCDTKIIFGVFDNLGAKLLAKKHSGSVYFISECLGTQNPESEFLGSLRESEKLKSASVRPPYVSKKKIQI